MMHGTIREFEVLRHRAKGRKTGKPARAVVYGSSTSESHAASARKGPRIQGCHLAESPGWRRFARFRRKSPGRRSA